MKGFRNAVFTTVIGIIIISALSVWGLSHFYSRDISKTFDFIFVPLCLVTMYLSIFFAITRKNIWSMVISLFISFLLNQVVIHLDPNTSIVLTAITFVFAIAVAIILAKQYVWYMDIKKKQNKTG